MNSFYLHNYEKKTIFCWFSPIANIALVYKVKVVHTFFWILVHMKAIYQCAKERLPQSNGVQIRTPEGPLQILTTQCTRDRRMFAKMCLG